MKLVNWLASQFIHDLLILSPSPFPHGHYPHPSHGTHIISLSNEHTLPQDSILFHETDMDQ